MAKLSQTCLLHLVEQVMGGGQHHLQGAAGHAGVGHALQGPTVHRNIPVSYSSSGHFLSLSGVLLFSGEIFFIFK